MSFVPNGISHLLKTADAVTALLNAQLAPYAFIRNYADFDEKLEDMGAFHGDVVPVKPDDADVDGRSEGDEFRVRIHIGIRQRFGSDARKAGTNELDQSKIDPLVVLAENVHRLVTHKSNRRLLTYEPATWEQTIMRTCAAREHLRNNGQFTALLELVYKIHDDNP